MKVKRVLAAIVCLLVACLGFAGCEWGNKKYSLELSVNNVAMGEVKSKPAQNEYQKGTEITVVATAKDGFEFVNWLDFETKSIILTASGVPEGKAYTFNIEKNTKLQAVFQRVISFVYNLDGGHVKGTEATTINAVKNVKLNDVISLPVLEKEGYDFLGWTLNIDPETTIETATYTVSNLPANRADIVATARFRESKTVNFDLGGGKVEGTNAESLDSVADVKTGTEITLPTLVKTGYEFKGWQLKNRPITDGKYTITNSDLNAEGGFITFSARWTAKKYPLVLNIKDATAESGWKNINTAGTQITYDQAIGELIKFDDAGENAYFWYTDEAFTKAVNETALWQDDSKETVTFYGDVKAAKKYTIKVDETETVIKLAANDEKEYNIVKDILKLEKLTKEGYEFKGFSLAGAEPVATIKYATSNAGVYEAKFDIKQYAVTFGSTATEGRVTFAAEGYSDATINPDYNTEIKFKVTVNDNYTLVDVYYTVEGSKDKHILTADANGVYTFNVPANNVVISATTKIIYAVNYFDGETKLEDINAETYVTKLLQGSNDLEGKIFYSLPDFDKNFGGWALTAGVTDAKNAVITRDGTITEGFWTAVSEASTDLNLYAVWINPTAYSNYTYSMTKDGYSIVPLVTSTYSEKFNKNVGLYDYLTNMSQKYGNRLEEIKANVTSVNSSNQAEIMAYNMLTLFNLNNEEVIARGSQAKFNNLIVIDNNEIVEMTANITVYIRDANNTLLASNASGAITLNTLKSLTGDIRIEFAFLPTNA